MTTVPWQHATRRLAVLAALTVVQLFAESSASADYDVGAIHIAQPWARATPKGGTFRGWLLDGHQQRHNA
jgi:copper(I)-binding protein